MLLALLCIYVLFLFVSSQLCCSKNIRGYKEEYLFHL